MIRRVLLRTELVLILAAPFHGHARRELELARKPIARLLDESPQVAALDVGLHEGAEAAVLTGDFAGPQDAFDRGDLPQRDRLALRRKDEGVIQPLNFAAFVLLKSHLDGKAFTALDGGGDVFAAEAGLDDIQDVPSPQPVARHGGSIDFDFQVGLVLVAGGGHTGGAGDSPEDFRRLQGLFLKRVQVVPEDFDAHLGADACAQHQDPALDRMQESRNITGQLAQFLGQFGDQFLLRHAGTPFRLGFQFDGRLDHLDRRRIGGGFGTAELAGRGFYLGHLLHDAVLPGDHAS